MLKNPVLVKNMKAAIDAGKAIHLMGLVGTGGVHSHADHWYGVLEMATPGCQGRSPALASLDGRDTDPTAAGGFLVDLQAKLDERYRQRSPLFPAVTTPWTVINNWDREEKVYAAFVYGEGNHAANAVEVEASYTLM